MPTIPPPLPQEPEQLVSIPQESGQIKPSLGDIDRANLIASLPDPDVSDDPDHYQYNVRSVKNPVTGQIVKKAVPWFDPNKREIILEEYVPGLEVSAGRKIPAPQNLKYEFDDPSDPENLRFFEWRLNIYDRVMATVFREIDMRPDKKVGVIGVNFGGTIMMQKNAEGVLVPTGEIQQKFRQHVEHRHPDCICQSFSFPRSKTTADGEASYGVDSSQLEIDFIADAAIAKTSIWNDLSEKEKHEFAGFVMAIGTDTCVEAMTILKTMLGPNCPFSVVAVGAMKPLEDAGSDGMVNFQSAFDDLLTLRKRGLTVVGLRVEGGLYDPTKTRKVSDKLGPSFQGEKFIDAREGETAETVDAAKFRKAQEADFTTKYEDTKAFRGINEVKTIKAAISTDTFELEREVSNSESKAILVETYPSFTQAMKDMKAILKGAKGRPIFYVNQVLGGSVDQAYEVAHQLKKHGIHALDMTTETARAKLNLAIRLFGNDRQRIIDYMTGKDVESIQEATGGAVQNALTYEI